jgi:hypothetical protein
MPQCVDHCDVARGILQRVEGSGSIFTPPERPRPLGRTPAERASLLEAGMEVRQVAPVGALLGVEAEAISAWTSRSNAVAGRVALLPRRAVSPAASTWRLRQS